MAETDQKENVQSASWARKLILVVFLSAFFILFTINGLINLLNIGDVEYTVLDDQLSADVYFADGHSEHSDSNYFPAARKGDTIVVHVPLKARNRKDGQAICFDFYNGISTVSYKDKVLYTYGEERVNNKYHVGHLIISAAIPDEAWGDEITLTLVPEEKDPYTNLKRVLLLSAVDARWYPLLNNQFDFIIFFPILIFSGIAMIAFFFSMILGYKQSIQGFCLALFLFGVSCWYLGYQGIFYLFCANIPVCANIEYQAMYMFMIPFLGYLRREKHNFVSDKILPVLEILFIIFFVGTNTLYFLKTGIDHSDFINYYRGLIILSLLAAVVSMFMPSKEKADIADQTLRYGLVAVMSTGIIETVRITTVSLFDIEGNRFIQAFISMNFSRIMILIFLFSLVSSFILRVLNNIRLETQRIQLSRLAYFDLLTGIPNRQDCDRNFNAMTPEQLRKCAVLFFDANDLKIANDSYGHECGDILLKLIGSSLKTAMENHQGFFGRYGGDEFIACLYDGNKTKEVCDKFYECIDEANQKKLLPFEVRVASGRADLKEHENDTYNDRSHLIATLVREADERMYKNKQEMKKNRQ